MKISTRIAGPALGLLLWSSAARSEAQVSDVVTFTTGTFVQTFTFQETPQDDPFGKTLFSTSVNDTTYLSQHAPAVVIGLEETGIPSNGINFSDVLEMQIGPKNGGQRSVTFLFWSDPPEDGTFAWLDLNNPVTFIFPENGPVDVTNALFGNGGPGQEHQFDSVVINSDVETPEPGTLELVGVGLAVVGPLAWLRRGRRGDQRRASGPLTARRRIAIG